MSRPNEDSAMNRDNIKKRILLAEDDSEMLELETTSLRREGYDVVKCESGWELLERVGWFLDPKKHKYEPFDLIVSDIRMPGVTGLDILNGLHQAEGFPPMILITAFGDEHTHAEAKRFKAAAMIDKPFEMKVLLDHVRRILEDSNKSSLRPEPEE